MMKRFLLVSALLAPVLLEAQERPDRASLTGAWVGDGELFDKSLHSRVGRIPIRLEVGGPVAAGRVGSAAIEDIEISQRSDLVQLTGTVRGSLHDHPQLQKKHIIVLITSISDSTMHAEFHLKSNKFFDMRMREGSVVLRKVLSAGKQG